MYFINCILIISCIAYSNKSYVHRDAQAHQPGGCPTLTEKDTVNLHLLLAPLKKGDEAKLRDAIQKDGIRILYHESLNEGASTVISVNLSKQQLKMIFAGEIHYVTTNGSATDKQYCQLSLKRYSLPVRYKNKILQILVPDPQQN